MGTLSLPRTRLCCRTAPAADLLYRLAGIIPLGERDPTIPTNKETSLVGEQSNAYRILLRYDRKSRHRRIKKQRRYERLAATSQFRYTSSKLYTASTASQLCASR
jgi:hypothetical protein